MVQLGRLAKATVLSVAALLVWRYYLTWDTSDGGVDLLQRLEDERKACLWRKGLESSRVLGDGHTFSTLNCPVGQEAHPSHLCTAHLVYLNHTEKAFVARTPAASTTRYNNYTTSSGYVRSNLSRAAVFKCVLSHGR